MRLVSGLLGEAIVEPCKDPGSYEGIDKYYYQTKKYRENTERAFVAEYGVIDINKMCY